MGSSERFRSFVVARSGGACEYCRLVEFATGMTFHIEHVTPLSEGGRTLLSNLALSCSGCNFAKSNRTHGVDSHGRIRRLFNPREYKPGLLGWHLHFQLDRDSGVILPRSEVGEATVAALQMNIPSRVYARKLHIEAGLIV